jgi:excisionase family DNA binding protein
MPFREDYLTIAEASKFLGVTRQTVSRWIKDGRFNIEKFGRQILIDEHDVLELQGNILGSLIIRTIKYLNVYLIKGVGGYEDDAVIKFKKVVDNNVFQFTILKADKSVDIINIPITMSIGYKNKKYYLDFLQPSNLKLLINKSVKEVLEITTKK